MLHLYAQSLTARDEKINTLDFIKLVSMPKLFFRGFNEWVCCQSIKPWFKWLSYATQRKKSFPTISQRFPLYPGLIFPSIWFRFAITNIGWTFSPTEKFSHKILFLLNCHSFIWHKHFDYLANEIKQTNVCSTRCARLYFCFYALVVLEWFLVNENYGRVEFAAAHVDPSRVFSYLAPHLLKICNENQTHMCARTMQF